ncbi:MAG TPA: nuclear transport factor 2 family protein [Candidatus Bathyarchaeia archaeon]|nr:nuclear transport factor 2 family protein [Candidatus Bathyarchaeia archaeon]
MLRSTASTMRAEKDRDSEKEILEVERKFGEAMIQNDAEAIGRILSDDWIIIDPDGGVIDKSRFLDVIKSGALKHEAMDSEDIRVRTYPNTATVTAVTHTRTKYLGKEFTTHERSTDVFVKKDERWQCVLTHLTTLTKKT